MLNDEKTVTGDGDNSRLDNDTREKKKKIILRRRMSHLLEIIIVCLIAAGGTVLAFAVPLRPSVSESEKRDLAEFPEFSPDALIDGSYFGGISTWFSDTFPFRDELVEINSVLRSMIGVGSSIRNPDFGNTGEEIPTEYYNGEDVIINTTAPKNDETPTQPANNEVTTAAPEVTTAPESSTPIGTTQSLGSILIYEDAAYEYYAFVSNVANAYVTAINRCASNLSGKANVYCMIIPTSTDITLNEQVRAKVSSDDQSKAINYMLGSMNSSVIKVPIFDVLREHRNEYIYFRTDHHWNGLGAYYGYAEFCKIKGINAVALDELKLKTFDNFTGSFYSDSDKNPALATHPDTVYAYYPASKTAVTVTQADGQTLSVPLIYDVSKNNSSNKYGTFIYGDNPFTVIENKDIAEGESCILVKESFGNALAPFLASHYKYVYVIDYRYYTTDIAALAVQYGATDVIFANNVSMTRSSYLVGLLQESTIG